MLSNKKILIGISGGIAAYKTIFLIRLLQKAGAEVKVIVTKNALEFVTKVTLESISKNKVYLDVFDSENDYSTEHISLSDWGDLFVVAPATANIVGKLASGIADDALSTSLLAFNKKVILCPAMNTKMYNHFSVKNNIDFLSKNGIEIIEPTYGDLACGYEGKGRMEEPEVIFEAIKNHFSNTFDFIGKTVLISAGPTYEEIDPVRFIGNHSTGIMGYALAEEFANRGANVILISGPTSLKINNTKINKIDIISASEMLNNCLKFYPKADIAIMAAAVADYTPIEVSKNKIKKSDNFSSVSLKKTIDILAELGKDKSKKQVLVGFALETNNEIENAKIKLHNKNLDFIVLNSLKTKGAGFGTQTNKVSIIDAKDKVEHFDLKPKSEVAIDIANKVLKIIQSKN